MLQDLDYFLTKNGIIYLVKGYYHPASRVLAYPVYWPDKDGDRHHPQLGAYYKDVSDIDNKKIFAIHPEYRHTQVPQNIPAVDQRDIKQIFRPRDKIASFLTQEPGSLWYDLIKYLIDEVGIEQADIGIFGSYLVGLHRDNQQRQIKDIDFTIYGRENMLRVKADMPKLLRHFAYQPISAEHIAYHAEKFGSKFDPSINSFAITLANKWSSIQIKPGLLATLRFVYKADEIPPNSITTPVWKQVQIEGTVIEDTGTNFMPRVFTMKSQHKSYQVVTYFWGWQACVRNGDQVVITGNLHQDGRTISLDSTRHGICIVVSARES